MTLYQKPSAKASDPEEQRLGLFLQGYTNPNRGCFRAELKDWVERHCVGNAPWQDTFRRICDFSELNLRFPRQKSVNTEEQKLGAALNQLKVRKRLGVQEWCDSHEEWRSPKSPKWETTFALIRQWAEQHQQFPTQHSKDPVERRLGEAFSAWSSQKSTHPEVAEWASANPQWYRYIPKDKSFEMIKNWTLNVGRTPSQHSKDPGECKLGKALSRSDPYMLAWKNSLPPEYRNKRGPKLKPKPSKGTV